MDFLLVIIFVLALIVIIVIFTKSRGEADVKNNISNGTASSKNENTDDEIINEILNSTEIAIALAQELPWKNRKYKGYSFENLEEMHKKLMNNWQAASEENKSKIMNEVGSINSEFMIRRQIQIHRASKKPINISDPKDDGRLKYLLEEKMKDYLYKVQTEGLDYFNSKNIVNERIKSLHQKYKEMGFDEDGSDLRAKCEMLDIKLESEPSSPSSHDIKRA